ncbi:MAG: hypothetical protein ACK5L3_07955 [Oscillospiraceae bacterium]
MVILVGCLAAALAVVLGLNLFLLWGRGAAVASSGGGTAAAASQGGSPATAVSQSGSTASAASAGASESWAWVEEWGFITVLPEGPYTPAREDTLDKLLWSESQATSWLAPIAPDEEVMQYRFYEDGSFSISTGFLQTDAGWFYHGEYTYLGDGLFSASVCTYEYMGEDAPPTDYVDLTVLVEWPPKGFDRAVITLVQYEAKEENSNFPMVFDDMVGKQLPFTRYT